MIKRRQILIAGMGTSPAVLTNVVWALAHGVRQHRRRGTHACDENFAPCQGHASTSQ